MANVRRSETDFRPHCHTKSAVHRSRASSRHRRQPAMTSILRGRPWCRPVGGQKQQSGSAADNLQLGRKDYDRTVDGARHRVAETMKQLLKRAIALTPYRVTRSRAQNRFSAIDACLEALRRRGYAPKIVIDGGANVGMFSTMAATIFRGARFHLVEPQPTCHAALRDLCRDNSCFELHPVALSDKNGAVSFTVTDGPSTGAHVTAPANHDSLMEVPSATIDALFPDLTPADRCFLKMDLEAHELYALKGAEQSLAAIEVVLAEVSFIDTRDEPGAARIVAFLERHGFDLYDVAALAGRKPDDRARHGDLLFVNRTSSLSR